MRYPPGGAARDARYTRYASATHVLRTQTSAMVPPVLRRLAREPDPPADVLVVCPGIVLLRITLRAPGRTLTDEEANRLRDEVYAAIHEGTRREWAGRG